MIRQPARDGIPVGPSRQQAAIDIWSTEERRRSTNDRATMDMRAVPPVFEVGDNVVVRDRHRGWTFCTPYEKKRWRVIRVNGTMITVQRGQCQLTRNVTWFQQATPRQNTSGEDPAVYDDSLLDLPWPASPLENTEQPRCDGSRNVPSSAPAEVGVRLQEGFQ